MSEERKMTDNNPEVKAIKEAILKYYHDGHAKYRPDLYEQVLHPEWKFFMLDGGELNVVNREEFCTWYAPEKLNPDLDWETEFYSIDVTGNIASVKLRLENQIVRYIDYLNMMKIDGVWWIVHKLSHNAQKGN
jgi:hypothetical protein